MTFDELLQYQTMLEQEQIVEVKIPESQIIIHLQKQLDQKEAQRDNLEKEIAILEKEIAKLDTSSKIELEKKEEKNFFDKII